MGHLRIGECMKQLQFSSFATRTTAFFVAVKDHAMRLLLLICCVLMFSSAQASPRAINWVAYKVQPGDSLERLFLRAGVSTEATDHLADKLAEQGLLIPKTRDQLKLQISGGKLKALVYTSDELGRYSAIYQQDDYKITHEQPDVRQLVTKVRLSGFTTNPARQQLADQVKAILSQQFPKLADENLPDSVRVVHEERLIKNKPIGKAKVLAIETQQDGKRWVAIAFKSMTGENEFIQALPITPSSSFDRTPGKHAHISSFFNVARMHPILRRLRPHEGIDFAAPYNTPVHVTASGIVSFAGVKGGYGNIVIVDHGNDLETRYAHLARIPADLQLGSSVKQGDVIGFVGQSGLATGPHLHYEVRQNGIAMDPAGPLPQPTYRLVGTGDEKRFNLVKARILRQLNQNQDVASRQVAGDNG